MAATLSAPSLLAAPAGEGLFATFVVKRGAVNLGEFSCQLEYEKVPRTVANFVGLAEGTKPFIDFLSGHATMRPFYNGITFHRVVAGFVVQAGSPKGDGSDGPSYTFPDEFDPTLRHSSAGILSMANSGLNSNGSQFFVTLESTPGLDDVHSVFGEVIEGMNVVTNIQQGDVIESVTIVRNGAAAQAFDASAHDLPMVGEANPSLAKTSTGFELNFAQPANMEFFIFHSDAFAMWSQLAGKDLQGDTPAPEPRDVSLVTDGKPVQFFNVARVQYPDAIYTPPAVAGKKLNLANASAAGVFTLELSLTAETTGTFTLTSSGQPIDGTVNLYYWTQEAYRGRFVAGISGLSIGVDPVTQTSISFVFDSVGGEHYAGSLLTFGGQTAPLAGTFTVADLP